MSTLNPKEQSSLPPQSSVPPELFKKAPDTLRKSRELEAYSKRESTVRRLPVLAVTMLVLLILGALLAPILATRAPSDFFLLQANTAPSAEFWFGTDPLGRDLYSLIWYALRSSMAVGLISFAVSTLLAVSIGVVCALSPDFIDRLLQRALELLQSIPQILLLMVFCSVLSTQSIVSLGLIIGSCSFFGTARLVRTQVKQISGSDFILAARGLGSGRLQIARLHLLPTVLPALSFALTANLSQAVASEAVLSFLGLGLPPEILSLGGLLSVSQRAFLMNSWWCVLIPGLFLIALLGSVTALGSYLQHRRSRPCSYL